MRGFGVQVIALVAGLAGFWALARIGVSYGVPPSPVDWRALLEAVIW